MDDGKLFLLQKRTDMRERGQNVLTIIPPIESNTVCFGYVEN
jgi:hypothetical protein